MSRPKLSRPSPKRTHPLIWCAAIICTIIAIAVIIAGLVVFIGYMIVHPRVPFITITYAHLDSFNFDQVGQMDIQITMVVKAENDNSKAHATFSDLKFFLYFQNLQLAELKADAFEVPKNRSKELQYVVPSLSIPLERKAMEEVDASIKQGMIAFDLKGDVRTRWRVGVVGSFKFRSHLSCKLKFLTVNGTSTNSPCSSKSN